MAYVNNYTALLPNPVVRWNGATDIATPMIITYCFLEGSEIPSQSQHVPWNTNVSHSYLSMDAARRAGIELALAEFEEVSGVKFLEVDSHDNSDISFLNNHSTDLTSWAYYPIADSYSRLPSYVTLTEDSLPQYRYDSDWSPGGVMFNLALHEIGHAMGLEHPHDGTLLNPAFDNANYTIMSYNDNWSGWTGYSNGYRPDLAPMDVDALQHLYGTQNDFNSSWTWSFDDITDKFQLTGSSQDDTLIAIRASSEILGGGGDDTIIGSSYKDQLDGGTGEDVLRGGDGHDVYYVDNAADVVEEDYSAGNDRVFVEGLSSWTVPLNVERVTFVDDDRHVIQGNFQSNRFDGNAGIDIFRMDEGGADIFSGGLSLDIFDGRVGTFGMNLNLVTGQHSGDIFGKIFASVEIFWGSDSKGDTMLTGAARSKFYGFGGNDHLTGAASVDYLDGGEGNDILNGMSARDGLRGNSGNDTLTGGADRDYFHYVQSNFGQDQVLDYEDGLDYLKVYSAVADDVSDFTITGNGTSSVSVVLNDGTNNNSIQINSDDNSAVFIDAGDFLFY